MAPLPVVPGNGAGRYGAWIGPRRLHLGGVNTNRSITKWGTVEVVRITASACRVPPTTTPLHVFAPINVRLGSTKLPASFSPSLAPLKRFSSGGKLLLTSLFRCDPFIVTGPPRTAITPACHTFTILELGARVMSATAVVRRTGILHCPARLLPQHQSAHKQGRKARLQIDPVPLFHNDLTPRSCCFRSGRAGVPGRASSPPRWPPLWLLWSLGTHPRYAFCFLSRQPASLTQPPF